jgi:hypothetical protein
VIWRKTLTLSRASCAKKATRAYRRYELRAIGGRLMLVRNELDCLFDLALSDVFGCEIESDEKNGMFFD